MAEKLSFAQQYATYPGKTLGDYTLEKLVEQLEVGPVFLARHTRTRERYRLRFLALPAGLSSEERLVYLGHFQREAGQVESLRHAAILPLSDYGMYEGAPYLVSPDLESAHSLHALLASNGPLDVARAGYYLDGIAAALEYAHQQGILHLNLNARTTMLKADGQIVVTDFALLRMLSPQGQTVGSGSEPRLENGAPLLRDKRGKPLYGLNLASAPAPELLLGQPVDSLTDIYALGALLYQLLTGHRVLRAENLSALVQEHLKNPPPSLNIWRQDLPAGLDRVLGRALAKEQAERFRSAGALANAYAQVATPHANGRKAFVVVASPAIQAVPAQVPTQPVQAPRHPSAMPTRSRERRQARLSRRQAISLLAAGGGVVVVAATTGFFLTANSGSSTAHSAHAGGTAPISTGSKPTPGSSGKGQPPAPSGKVIGSVAAIAPNSAASFPIANSPNPGVLINLGNNRFVAFNSTCTHAGCAVKYNPGDHLLECPCHGAVFDPAKNAQVVSGPAPSPLTAIPITVNANGTITENS